MMAICAAEMEKKGRLHGGGFVAALGADFHFGAVLSPNARSERMLTALASRAAVRRVILAGASPLINFTSSPAGRACMPFGAVIVTFPVVI